MAMQVDPTLVLVSPGPERVVAEHHVRALDTEFRVRSNAAPAGGVDNLFVVVVADEQMLPAMHDPEEIIDVLA